MEVNATYHVVVAMLVPQHVRRMLLALRVAMLRCTGWEPQRDNPLSHVTEVHAVGCCYTPAARPRLVGKGVRSIDAIMAQRHLEYRTFNQHNLNKHFAVWFEG